MSNTCIRYAFTYRDGTKEVKSAVVEGAITEEQMRRIRNSTWAHGGRFVPALIGLPDELATDKLKGYKPIGYSQTFCLDGDNAFTVTDEPATEPMDIEEVTCLFKKWAYCCLFTEEKAASRDKHLMSLAEIRVNRDEELRLDVSSRDYKISQLKTMLKHETAKHESHYNAKLSHWAGDTKTIDIDAGALLALINYYQSMPTKEDAEILSNNKGEDDSADESANASAVCPYCGSTNTDMVDSGKESEKRRCADCGEDDIFWHEGGESTDRHNRPIAHGMKGGELFMSEYRVVMTCWDYGNPTPYADELSNVDLSLFATEALARKSIEQNIYDELSTLNEGREREAIYDSDGRVVGHDYPFRADFDGDNDGIIRFWDGEDYQNVTEYHIHSLSSNSEDRSKCSYFKYRGYCIVPNKPHTSFRVEQSGTIILRCRTLQRALHEIDSVSLALAQGTVPMQ